MATEAVFSILSEEKENCTDFSKCIICQAERQNTDVLYSVTEQGFSSLDFAIRNRNDNIAKRLKLEVNNRATFQLNNPKWHKNCRNTYTNKKTVQQHIAIKPKLSEEDISPAILVPKMKIRRSLSTLQKVNLTNVCFICEKERTSYGEWKLVLISTKERERSVLSKAIEMQDDAMLIKIDGYGKDCVDMIAKNLRYHRTCMTKYLNKKKPVGKSAYVQKFDTALLKLVSEIHTGLFEEKRVYRVTDLLKRYIELLDNEGAESKSYQSKRLIQRLKEFYSTQPVHDIIILPQKGLSSLLCSSQLSMADLLKALTKLQRDIEDSEDIQFDFEPE